MDYEKKYKEALEQAKNINNEHRAQPFDVMTKVFPELKESSEDEKIKEQVIYAINQLHVCECTKNKLKSWLEKQDKKNPIIEGTFVNVDEVREDFMREVYRVLNDDPNNDRANQIIDAFDHLPTIIIQNPIDKVEPKFNVGDTIIKKHNSDINDFGQFTITDITGGKYWYRDKIICDITEQNEWELYEPIEQNSAWSEEDETKLKSACALIRNTSLNGNEGVVDTTITWLKALKDRVQHQWNQEWSEDDKGNLLIIKHIVDGVWHNQDFREDIGYSTEELESLWNWLDSIWQRVKYPQNTWKPSKEQMKALHDLNLTGNMSYAGQGQKLIDLYNDLKKLREE